MPSAVQRARPAGRRARPTRERKGGVTSQTTAACPGSQLFLVEDEIIAFAGDLQGMRSRRLFRQGVAGRPRGPNVNVAGKVGHFSVAVIWKSIRLLGLPTKN